MNNEKNLITAEILISRRKRAQLENYYIAITLHLEVGGGNSLITHSNILPHVPVHLVIVFPRDIFSRVNAFFLKTKTSFARD